MSKPRNRGSQSYINSRVPRLEKTRVNKSLGNIKLSSYDKLTRAPAPANRGSRVNVVQSKPDTMQTTATDSNNGMNNSEQPLNGANNEATFDDKSANSQTSQPEVRDHRSAESRKEATNGPETDINAEIKALESSLNRQSFSEAQKPIQPNNLIIPYTSNAESEEKPEYHKKWITQENEIRASLGRYSYDDLFVDKYFDLESPKNDLIRSSKGDQLIKWLRPHEITKNPTFGSETTNYKDVVQGVLEDCALISAIDTISKYPHLLKNIFRNEVDLNSVAYNGSVELRFWVRDEWITIFIDDRLPTIGKKLCYSRCARFNCFWVPLLEKGFAKLRSGYQNLIGIDPAYALVCLTGGMVLRLNPTHLNDREPILHYLNNSKENSLIIGVAGSELIKNEKSERATLVKPVNPGDKPNPNKNRYVSTQRIGHSYSLIDVIHFAKLNKAYIKLRNCQVAMRVYKEINNEKDMKLIEKVQNSLEESKEEAKRNGIMYFSYEEFFEYFEIITLVVLMDTIDPNDDKPKAIKNFTSAWTPQSSLMNAASQNVNLLQKYLDSPHFLFKITNDDPTNIDGIHLIYNVLTEDFSDKEFMGSIILPVRKRILGSRTAPGQSTSDVSNFGPANQQNVSFSFVNYTLQRQTLTNLNPLCAELKLLPGKYFFGLVIQGRDLPKPFTLRLAISALASIKAIDYNLQQIGNDRVLHLRETNDFIKLVLPYCCTCGCILDRSYLSSGAKVFCQPCYNAAFRCEICNIEVGHEYYTIEQRICCKNCLKKYKDFIEKTNFGF